MNNFILREFIRESVRQKQLNEFDFLDSIKSLKDAPIVKGIIDFFSSDNNGQKDPQQLATALQEKIPLTKSLSLDRDKNALVIGSSQISYIGQHLEDKLHSLGFIDIDGIDKVFTSTSDMISYASSISNVNIYDIVIILAGYDDDDDSSSIEALIKKFNYGTCFVVLPLPVTMIDDMQAAVSLGLGNENEISIDHWFKLVGHSGNQYSKMREDATNNMEDVVIDAGGSVIDLRGMTGETQPSGVIFPNNLDGIHPTDKIASDIANKIMDEIKNSTAQIYAGDLAARVSHDAIKSNPTLLSQLMLLPGLSYIFSKGYDLGRTTGTGFTGAATAGVEFAPGNNLTPQINQFIRVMRNKLDPSIPIYVTSGERDTHSQASAMFTKWKEGGEHAIGTLYTDSITSAFMYVINNSTGLSDAEMIKKIEEMIVDLQNKTSFFKSSHMIGNAVDIRTKNLTYDQAKQLVLAAKAAGAKTAFLENDPPHMHVTIV